MAIFDFRDASFKGPQEWQSASRWTSHAPLIVLNLLLLSIIEVILGILHITSINKDTTGLGLSQLTFAQVIQPLVVPALSFFNTIPSLHLHVLARSNKPLMAMIFSGFMCVIYLVSAVVFLPPCVGGFVSTTNTTTTTTIANTTSRTTTSTSATRTTNGYQNTECPIGTKIGVWSAMVALQFLSALGYALHFAMATKVRSVTKKRIQDEKEGRVVVVVDQEAKAKRDEEARRRWTEIRDL